MTAFGMQPSPPSPGDLPLAPNALARAYQPRRLRAAVVSIAWNLAWLALFLAYGGPQWLMRYVPHDSTWAAPLYVAMFFALYATIACPIEAWYGYILERQFGLVKQGLRTWGRDWFSGVAQHGTLFVIGSWLMLAAQQRWPQVWLQVVSAGMLVLFLLTTYFAGDLIPPRLFEIDRAEEQTMHRLQALAGAHRLPPVSVFTSPELREFSGGLIGLGRRQVLLISRPTIELGSDALLRFVLLHELGHRHFHHLPLSMAAAWGYATAGLVFSDAIVVRLMSGLPPGSPMYIPWLALFLTLWMVAGQPALAYLGRRMEYQADRFYLDHGGTLAEMSAALRELSHRDLARTDTIRRRQSLVAAVPIVARRLKAAETHFAGGRK